MLKCVLKRLKKGLKTFFPFCLDRSRRSIGQEHRYKASRTTASESLSARIHGENPSTKGSQRRRHNQQILRRPYAYRTR